MEGGETLDERTLRRTIALLVSLAVLAERTAARSFPVRWFVLVVLRYAERVALDHVIESAPWAWPHFEDELETGSGPMDAMLLGQRLRLLAAVLGALLPPEDLCFDDWNAGRDGARPGGTSFARPAVTVTFGPPQGLYDTS